MAADLGPIATYPSPPNHPSSSHHKLPGSSPYESGTMAGSLSPNPPHPSHFGGTAAQEKSSLSSLNLNFLKTLTEKRSTRDGQPPKRRGPKPDSKPALTRRQELNRQAQRTHRERKELYIKALEDEVLRLKEIYSNVSQDKERLAEENRRLRALLAQNGTPTSAISSSGFLDDSISNPSVGGYASSGSGAAPPSSLTSGFTSSPVSARSGASPNTAHPPGNHSHHHHPHHQHSGQGQAGTGLGLGGQSNRNPSMDYDQAGIDFVLTLEKPCMDHLPWLLERGTEVGGNEPCGHALMASCPPEAFPELTPDIPFGYSNVGGGGGGGGELDAQRTWELSKGDLATLLDLSKRLNLDGEITPVMAWGMVLGHPRLAELRPEDLTRLSDELGSKVRCYGFGAVMEEFEVRDALENILSMKSELAMVY